MLDGQRLEKLRRRYKWGILGTNVCKWDVDETISEWYTASSCARISKTATSTLFLLFVYLFTYSSIRLSLYADTVKLVTGKGLVGK